MEPQSQRQNALVELDGLQNELLARLDELNQRVARVLAECNATRKKGVAEPA